jgi:hypothetical protein
MLTDRFGAFEAIAIASIKLARHVPEDELSTDLLVAEAVLEFGDDLRQDSETVAKWAGGKGAAGLSRFWKVRDPAGVVCLIVYRDREREVVRRLAQ